jgi:hypothetical protein
VLPLCCRSFPAFYQKQQQGGNMLPVCCRFVAALLPLKTFIRTLQAKKRQQDLSIQYPIINNDTTCIARSGEYRNKIRLQQSGNMLPPCCRSASISHQIPVNKDSMHRNTILLRRVSGVDQHFSGFDSSSGNKSAAGSPRSRNLGVSHIPACRVFQHLRFFRRMRSLISFPDL